MNTAFDTLAVSEELRKAKFTDAQAKALANTMGTAITGSVATKEDSARLEGKIDALQAEMRAEMRMIKAIGFILLAAIVGVYLM